MILGVVCQECILNRKERNTPSWSVREWRAGGGLRWYFCWVTFLPSPLTRLISTLLGFYSFLKCVHPNSLLDMEFCLISFLLSPQVSMLKCALLRVVHSVAIFKYIALTFCNTRCLFLWKTYPIFHFSFKFVLQKWGEIERCIQHITNYTMTWTHCMTMYEVFWIFLSNRFINFLTQIYDLYVTLSHTYWVWTNWVSWLFILIDDP